MGSSLPPANIELGNYKGKKSLYRCQQVDTKFMALSHGSAAGAERDGFQVERVEAKRNMYLQARLISLPVTLQTSLFDRQMDQMDQVGPLMPLVVRHKLWVTYIPNELFHANFIAHNPVRELDLIGYEPCT